MKSNRRENDGGGQSQFSASTSEAGEPKTIPFAQRLTCTISEACQVTGLGRTKLYELMGAGHLLTTTVGRRRLVMVRSLLSLLEMNISR
jgi:excisionase family DNA binding protein